MNSAVAGLLLYPSGIHVTFIRAWYYWQVTSSEPLPKEPARQLNDRCGDVVRVDGCAGGKTVDDSGVASWHVDTDMGLSLLVNTLNAHFGSPIKITQDFAARTGILKLDAGED